jgi:hypothetical protein
MYENDFNTDIDNQLFATITSENIATIKSLVNSGANINAIDKRYDNMIMKYLQEKEHESNIEIIKSLVELGINTNYEAEGFNCLFNAYLANRADIVEYLLKAGTSAQCISTDSCETLLDWIEWDIEFEKDEHRTAIEWITESEKILQLLRNYGAKNAKNCFTKIVDEYLKMFGGNITGLFTKKGYIYIQDLSNITNELIKKYNDWHNIDNIFIEKIWNNENIDIEKLVECNNMGLEIIKSIKKLLPDNIKIQINSIIPEDYEKYRTRNIRKLVI